MARAGSARTRRREAPRRGWRYLSNIAIVQIRAELANLPADILATPLAACTDAGRFNGRYGGPARREIEDRFEQKLARIFEHFKTPRLSGVQIKAPVSLLADGDLVPAIDQPFMHILKPAGTAGYEMLPVVEWICLEFGRAAGFEVLSAALKDDGLGAQDFLALARTIGLGAGDAKVAMTEVAARLAKRAVTLRPPDFACHAKAAKSAQEKRIAIVSERSAAISRSHDEGSSTRNLAQENGSII